MTTEQTIPVKQTTGATTDQGNLLFPVFLKLEELKVLLVGGGKVGAEKLSALLGNSPAAPVTVVARSISEEVRKLAKHHPNVTLHERAFMESDLENKDLVVIAVNEKESSLAIRAAAKEKKILVNVADTPEQCDFYLSSIVQKGNLKIAISTNGKSPTAAKRIKEVLNYALPAELDDMINNLHAVRNKLNGNFEYKVKRLNELTRILIEKDNVERERRVRKIVTYSLIAFGLMLIGHFLFSYLPFQRIADDTVKWYQQLDPNFHWMLLAGFLAQLVDGALGMGYGVTSATILLTAGVPPAAMSGSIHTAEMFASGASGYSHYKFGNVNKKLFKALVIPGVLGAVFGAILLVKFGDSQTAYIKPVIATYTMLLGIRILWNAFKKEQKKKKFKHYGWLAGFGGFLDSFGGGGWGPIVTTTLITKGRSPRFVIGSVSLTEFFVTLASAFTFFISLGVTHWQVIVALIIGGLLAAPVAAKLAGKLPRKTSMILLGFLVIFWSLKIIVKIF
ncbi:ABC transporter permease [Niastella vici]|uniref:Probable membrane transporter protein n=1 Tax=Niastella vici TaxID=1703345 RepID=A0A1V9FSY1_9BACT|nr:TSUP family transporter [Niastella vici]OQP61428.1 ABC transporter permease [Niastella vici]